jgi:hypothetical protein
MVSRPFIKKDVDPPERSGRKRFIMRFLWKWICDSPLTRHGD